MRMSVCEEVNDTKIEGQEEAVYRCNVCSYFSPIVQVFKRHHATHFKPTLKHYKCSYCTYAGLQETHLGTHVRQKHPKEYQHEVANPRKWYRCLHCPFASDQRDSFIQHSKCHVPIQDLLCAPSIQFATTREDFVFKCSKCHFQSIKVEEYDRHECKKSGNDIFSCTQCDYWTVAESSLKLHSRTHSTEPNYFCRYCSFSCRYRRDLTKHESSTHGTPNHHGNGKRKNTPEFMCPKCNFETKSQRVYDNHACKTSTPEVIKCQECNFWSPFFPTIKKHVKTHVKDRKKMFDFEYTDEDLSFKCPKCAFSSFSEEDYDYHRCLKRPKSREPSESWEESLTSLQCENGDFKCGVLEDSERHLQTHSNVAQLQNETWLPVIVKTESLEPQPCDAACEQDQRVKIEMTEDCSDEDSTKEDSLVSEHQDDASVDTEYILGI